MTATFSSLWETHDVEDGIMVALTAEYLSPWSTENLVDDLMEIVRESGRDNLYLDFDTVKVLASTVQARLLRLDRQLRERGGRLILVNLDPFVTRTFQASRVNGLLNVHPEEEVGVSC
ncbi:MAG: STAS domain-containing protein [Gemmataceae bacterium]|nr:STAS domain-containing protein [Gemmataceae bacterium]